MQSDPSLEKRLVFLIGPPRSGSTLLARMLGAHSAVCAPEEPHLITPLAHLGYFASVESAPYDPVITRQAARALVAGLPGGEHAYLDALRAYTDAIYRGLLAGGSGRATLLLDKTPAYALSLEFLARLYPGARYVVLTRHPLAVWSSYVDSFFDGDDRVAHAHNPLLERYVPAIARFLREAPVALHRVRYEELVRDPEGHARALADFLGLDFEPGMVDYGSVADAQRESTRGLGRPDDGRAGDPRDDAEPRQMGGGRDRPAGAGRAVPGDRGAAARSRPRDLGLSASRRSRPSSPASTCGGKPAPRPALTRYTLERKILVALRRRIRPGTRLGGLVRKLREICDVLLR